MFSARYEIPEFLSEQVVYCDNVTYTKNSKSCLVLANNVKLYEFHRKELVHTIDLNKTCLRLVSQRLALYEGPKGKFFESRPDNAELSRLGERSGVWADELQSPPVAVPEISFGKYIYRSFEKCKMYLLLRCWDKLVVLERLDKPKGFQITAEYEQVASYKLTHGRVKFEAVVEIQFKNDAILHTDFETKDNTIDGNQKATKTEFTQLLERVRIAKTELQLHRASTQDDFYILQDIQTFGSNFLRTFKLEEKQMLTRHGDVWERLTTEDLVIGVPLKNNCSTPNLTILKSVRPVLKINNEVVKGLNYHYQLLQLKQRFENLEALEGFFQSEDDQLQDNMWSCNKQRHLLPDSFAVLVLKLKVSQIIAMESCPLFVFYEVEKDLQLECITKSKTRVFEQHMFIKNLDIYHILSHQRKHEISFENGTLHQDLLATTITSVETKSLIKFASSSDIRKFETLLIAKFDLERQSGTKESTSSEDCEMPMELDENDEGNEPASTSTFPHFMLYNKKPNSIWYGLLALKAANTGEYVDELQTFWKFYTKSEEKACLLMKLLFNELILKNCNVDYIECPPHSRNRGQVDVIQFQNAMRQELQTLINIINNKEEKMETVQAKTEELTTLQLRTDCLALLLE